MTHIITIIIAVVIFGVIIAIHEFGHFIVAKLHHVQVNEFAIGMGPRILHFQKGETMYSLRLLPIGGFCSMEGEDESSDNPNAFEKKPVWRRITVVLAGAFMNIVLGFILIIVLTCIGTKVPSMTIAQFASTTDESTDETITASESERSGLQVGDKIVAIDGEHIFTTTDLVYKLQTTEAESFAVTVKRDGEKMTIENVTFHNDNTEGLIDFAVQGKSKNPVSVVVYSAIDTVATAKLIWMSLMELVFGKYGLQDLSGPVGTVSVIEQAASSGETILECVESVLNLTIFITVNVGVFNLLPIPGLDGSRFVFLAIEGIRRKPVAKEREAMVHFIGMAALFLLMILVTVQDVVKLV
ncbi:MAG: site-2 protease family protein [Ruminococcus sp.]|nr:site-2 protease family protein [Ruminococcus sp.]